MDQVGKLEKRAFIWLLLALLILGVYVSLPFINTIILSIILTVIFYPFHQRYLRWTKDRKNLASVCSVLTVLLILIIPLTVLVTLISSQVAMLVQKAPEALTPEKISGLLAHYKAYALPLINKMEVFFGAEINLADLISEGFRRLGQILAQYTPAVLTGTATFFLDFFIMLVFLFYLFRDGDQLYELVIQISPIKDQYERNLAGEIKGTIYGVFYGSFLTGMIQAVLATIAYYIAGIPGALVWGTITFFVSFIPIIGTAGVIVPMVIYLLVRGETGMAIFLAIYGGVIIGSSDNLLKPLLIKTNMHQALLFLSLFGGMAVFGPLGLLLGPIIMATLVGTVRIYQQDYLNNSGSASSTSKA